MKKITAIIMTMVGIAVMLLGAVMLFLQPNFWYLSLFALGGIIFYPSMTNFVIARKEKKERGGLI